MNDIIDKSVNYIDNNDKNNNMFIQSVENQFNSIHLEHTKVSPRSDQNPSESPIIPPSIPLIVGRYLNLWNITSLDQTKKHTEFSPLYYHGIMQKVIYFMKKITPAEFNDLALWFSSQEDHKYQIMQQIMYLAYTSRSVNL